MIYDNLFSVGKIVQQLGQLIPLSAMNSSEPVGLDLTELLIRIIERNGAPLFDLAIQVDDRNTSRFLLNVGLPRHSGIMPQFYSNIPKVILDSILFTAQQTFFEHSIRLYTSRLMTFQSNCPLR